MIGIGLGISSCATLAVKGLHVSMSHAHYEAIVTAASQIRNTIASLSEPDRLHIECGWCVVL